MGAARSLREGPPLNRVGAVSLAAAATGAIACHLAPLAGAPEGAWLTILRAGFDAATVGGLADWFAVTALFRHPLGLPIPHTAIISKRRDRITDSIVTIVEGEWLAPGVIEARLSRFHPSGVVLSWLQDPERIKMLHEPVCGLLRGAAHLLTQEEVVAGLDEVLRRQLHALPLGPGAGQWLSRIVASEGAAGVFESVVLSLSEVARRPSTARKIHDWMDHSAQRLEDDGKRLAPMLLRSRIVKRRLVEAACAYASDELRHAGLDPDHPLRRYTFEALGAFAGKVSAGDAEALGRLEQIRRALHEHLPTEPLTLAPLETLRAQLLEELDRPDAPLVEEALAQSRGVVLRIFDKPENRQAFEDWVKSWAKDIIERNHHQIGVTIRESLDALDTDTLVAQIEERLGSDLQYIRLNGALVGGIIGLLLAVAHLLLS